MADEKKLRHLSRIELLEILVALSEENESLKAEVASLKSRLDSKELMLNKAGSIAEAALSVNGVFEAAQAAAAQYLENVRNLSDNAQAVADRMLSDAKRECECMKWQTQVELNEKWNELPARMDQCGLQHDELQTILPPLYNYSDELGILKND